MVLLNNFTWYMTLNMCITLLRFYILYILINFISSEEQFLFDDTICGYLQSHSWLAASPWLASLRAINLESGLVFIVCTGVLVNHKYVITPAECLQHNESSVLGVQLGETYLRNVTIDPRLSPYISSRTFYKIQKLIVHPLYKPRQAEHNVALLRLDRFVEFTEYIQPICLPFKQNIPVIGSNLYTTVWGEFNGLFSSFPQSKAYAPSTLITNRNTEDGLLRTIEWDNATSSVCNAHLGVPLTFNKRNQSFVFGLLVRKAECGSNRINAYVNIFNYFKWIEENTYSHYDSCLTPDNQRSMCIPIEDCHPLIQAFANPKQKYEEYLFQHICSTVGGYQVCCPKTLNSMEVQADSTSLSSLSNKKFCGYQHRDDYFSNDSSIAIDEFPWLATLRIIKSDNKEVSVCSGSLINNRYVLTSAYCAVNYGGIVSVRLGEYYALNKTDCVRNSQIDADDCSESEEFGIEKIIIHPFYNSWTYNNDIALIRLNATVSYSEYIRPICLPIPTMFSPANSDDQFYTTSFTEEKVWGTDYLKKKLYYLLIESSLCERNQQLAEYQMCLFPQAMATDRFLSCYDDNAAPAMISKKNQWILQGIITDRKSYCKLNKPIAGSRISAFLPWIQENVEK